MTRYDSADYARLGQAVYEARTEAGLGRTVDWAEKVQRSSRVLLGLERGEKVGTATLNDVEDALGWPRGGAFRVMSGGVSWRDLSVGGPTEDASQYVESSSGERVEPGVSNDEVLQAIQEMRAAVDDLRQRLDRFEQSP